MKTKRSNSATPSPLKLMRPQTGLRIRTKELEEMFLETASSRTKTSSNRDSPKPNLKRGQSALLHRKKGQYTSTIGHRIQTEGSHNPKEIGLGNKTPLPLSVYHFKQFLPQSGMSPRLPIGVFSGKPSTPLANSKIPLRTDNGFADPFLSEIGLLETILNAKDIQASNTAQGLSTTSKKNRTEGLPLNMNRRFTVDSLKKPFEVSSSLLKSPQCRKLTTTSSKKDGISLAFPRKIGRRAVTSTRTECDDETTPRRKIMTGQDDDSLSLINGIDEGDNNPEEIGYKRDENLRKQPERPVSQAMFRMKEFKNVRNIILNKKKKEHTKDESPVKGQLFHSNSSFGCAYSPQRTLSLKQQDQTTTTKDALRLLSEHKLVDVNKERLVKDIMERNGNCNASSPKSHTEKLEKMYYPESPHVNMLNVNKINFYMSNKFSDSLWLC